MTFDLNGDPPVTRPSYQPLIARLSDQPIILRYHQHRTKLHWHLHRVTPVGGQVNYLNALTAKKKRHGLG